LAIPVLLALALLWQLAAALLTAPEWIGSYLTHDDTYLALQIARGWATHGYPTFDGIHRTNGFQPLWGLILVAFARCIDEPIALLRATLVFAVACNTLTGVLIARACRALRTDSAPLAKCAVALWCAYSVSGKPALIALENALLPALCAAILLALIAIWRDAASVPRWIAFGLLAAAIVWTRLDAVVLIAGCMAIAFVPALRTARWSGPLLACVLFGAALASYVAFQRWAGGTNTPVSGLVKRTIAERIEPTMTVASVAAALCDAANIAFKQAAIGVGLIRPQALSSAGRVAILLLLIVALVRARSAGVRWVGLTALLLFAHALAIRLWLSEYFHDTPWYYPATNLLAGLGVAILLLEVLPAARHRAVISCASAFFVLRLAASCWLLTQPPPANAVAPVRIAAAAWLRENVPPGGRVAAWNAGELSYFSGVTLINLDGLVNDAAYYREIIRAQGALTDYLKSQRVDWITDYAKGAEGGPWLWDVLPPDEWTIVARFGAHPDANQLVAQRRAPVARNSD
jgi:hypothetical protein